MSRCGRSSSHNFTDSAYLPAFLYSLASVILAKKKGFEDVTADALNLLGTMSVRSFQLSNALDLYKESLALNQKMRHYEAELLSLNNIAIIYE